MFWDIVLIIAALAALLYIFPIIQICGDSMYPTLNNGDIAVGCRFAPLKINDIYIFIPPSFEKDGHIVIKRLTKIDGDKLFFEGDNKKYSYDSRMYGYVDKKNVVAKYLFRIKKVEVV